MKSNTIIFISLTIFIILSILGSLLIYYYYYLPSQIPNIDCVTNEWINDGGCALNDVDGKYYQKQIRGITTKASGNGQTCPILSQQKSCIPNADCVTGAWVDDGGCVMGTDGNYYQKQKKSVTTAQSGTGTACGVLEQSNICTPNTNCVTSAWVNEGTCTKGTDGNFYQQQTRSITTPASGTGTVCPTLLRQGALCIPNINCATSEWVDELGCIQDNTGSWYQKQKRSVTTAQSGTGTVCPALSQSKSCRSGHLCNKWGKCLSSYENLDTDGNKIVQWDSKDENGQIWSLSADGSICNKWGKCLAVVNNGGTNNGASIVQSTLKDESDQKWAFTFNGNLCNKLGKCLSAINDSNVSGTSIIQWDAKDENGQKWLFQS